MTREQMIERLVLDSADTILAEMGEDDGWVYRILRDGFEAGDCRLTDDAPMALPVPAAAWYRNPVAARRATLPFPPR